MTLRIRSRSPRKLPNGLEWLSNELVADRRGGGAGHCSVHQRFSTEHIAQFRIDHPNGEVIVHPECSHEGVAQADRVGSTERILDWVEQAAPGSVLGIGTEIHMVQRMANEHPDVTVVSLDPLICLCSTMFRIDGPHLA